MSFASTLWMAPPTSTASSPSVPSSPSTKRYQPMSKQTILSFHKSIYFLIMKCFCSKLWKSKNINNVWFLPDHRRWTMWEGRPASRQRSGRSRLRSLWQRHHDRTLHRQRSQLLHAWPSQLFFVQNNIMFVWRRTFLLFCFCSSGNRWIYTGWPGREDQEERQDLQFERRLRKALWPRCHRVPGKEKVP